jgi:hypothetical protein
MNDRQTQGAEGSSIRPRKEAARKRSIFVRAARVPRNILTMAHSGKFSQASLRCLLAALLGLGVLSAWTLVFGVIYIAFRLNAFDLGGMNAIGWIVVFMSALPGILAALVLLIGSVAGMVLGLLGVLRAPDSLMGAVGLVLNGGLLGVFIALLLPTLLALIE